MLCKESLRKFMDRFPYDILEADKLIEHFIRNVPTFNDETNIIFTNVYKLLTVVSEDGKEKKINIPFYKDEKFSDKETRMIKFKAMDGNSIIFEAISTEGWNEDRENDFKFISQLLFIAFGRVVSLKIMKESLVTDSLTKLPNKNAFDTFQKKLFTENKLKDYDIFYITIENIKFLNSKYGEAAGNQILIKFAKQLSSFTGKNGMAARFGGTNFVVLLKKEFKDEFIEKLQEKQIEISLPDNSTTAITLDFFCGMYSIKEGDNPNTAIDMSSIALDYGKTENQQRIVQFDEFMLNLLFKQKNILSHFDNAIKNNEFVVYYQPKVNIQQGKLCGAEALVRWIHEGKFISPADFIPVLEENGLVQILDFYVLRKTLSNIKEWTKRGLEPVRISTNFSKEHLKNPRFAEMIINLLEEYEIDPKYLEVELTETKDIEDMSILSEFVEKMHEHNIHSSIDDFGSGYSSLKLIKNVKADVIKLDKSIIDNIGLKEGDDEILVQNIVRMISELKRNAIAEGVENNEQAKFLKRIGCYMIQGYLFDKPLPTEEFENRLKEPIYSTIEG